MHPFTLIYALSVQITRYHFMDRDDLYKSVMLIPIFMSIVASVYRRDRDKHLFPEWEILRFVSLHSE
jgi:hypothetical protein